ncbi:thiamine-phosphate kinase [Leptolyngbya sp. Heron Island J]|uniref:thiamine-phosphate kinase n=1 Tax=Leptolyngbya sp. Heron Island J TaxID=1385935 RepID=UPI0003B98F8A|nr:thiamine-phosphate kinase [Leptolyngbya sp. Heron Island J]ESA36623.1 thiamine-phosphate kinase [Leptolyngbya sp. Heron Island J]
MIPVTVADLGEHEILRRLRPYCAAVVGDDGAVRSLPAGEQLVVTTDVLVDQVHFSDRTLPPHALGWRAAAVNLSDLAAMAATPMGVTIGLTLPPDTPWSWVDDLYQGFKDCLDHHGGAILGGDLCRGHQRSLAITALGTVLPGQALYRNRAKAGQMLVATGVHGAARAGLALLLAELDLVSPAAEAWIQAHQQPVPRFDAIAALQTHCQDLSSIAAMDTSDGLADAIIQICDQSQVGATLLRSQLPIPPGLVEAVGQTTAEQWTLYGGEDFELLLSLPPEIAGALSQALPDSQIIGHTTLEPEIRLRDDVNHGTDIPLDQDQGYQHFQG